MHPARSAPARGPPAAGGRRPDTGRARSPRPARGARHGRPAKRLPGAERGPRKACPGGRSLRRAVPRGRPAVAALNRRRPDHPATYRRLRRHPLRRLPVGRHRPTCPRLAIRRQARRRPSMSTAVPAARPGAAPLGATSAPRIATYRVVAPSCGRERSTSPGRALVKLPRNRLSGQPKPAPHRARRSITTHPHRPHGPSSPLQRRDRRAPRRRISEPRSAPSQGSLPGAIDRPGRTCPKPSPRRRSRGFRWPAWLRMGCRSRRAVDQQTAHAQMPWDRFKPALRWLFCWRF